MGLCGSFPRRRELVSMPVAEGLRVLVGSDTRYSPAHDFCSFELFRLLVLLHNMIAIHVAFFMLLARLYGQGASDERPGGSVLLYLDAFQWLLREEGWAISRGYHCSVGSPFQKLHQWLHIESWLLSLSRGCPCGHAAGGQRCGVCRHLR